MPAATVGQGHVTRQQGQGSGQQHIGKRVAVRVGHVQQQVRIKSQQKRDGQEAGGFCGGSGLGFPRGMGGQNTDERQQQYEDREISQEHIIGPCKFQSQP